MPPALERLETQSVADRCYEAISRAITVGELRAGERLTERGLAASLNVSATPIREAIKRLEREGLVERPGPRTLVVTAMTPATLSQIIEARAAIRGVLARLAARHATPEQVDELMAVLDESDDLWRLIASRRADGLPIDDHLRRVADMTDRFNRLQYACAGNPLLVRLLEQTEAFNHREMRERTQRAMLDQQVPGNYRWKDDRAVVEAIARRDEAEAERITIQHVRKAMTEVLEIWPQTRGDGAPDES
ncbi:GntR family transcriptional regulator [Nocardioides humi]|uniref:GntR family transcriptional regulator n=1 Tax=Nocardioides humi TaxID=449461 RepID=A0ABN1ZPW1_9ACTN|nr:GntR family transcriptional regulator [Nocardioides humi]